MFDFRTFKYQPVEITVPNAFTGSSITFPDQPSLRGKTIKAVEVYNDGAMPYSPLTGGTTITAADTKKVFFEFFQGTNQFVNRIPYVALNRVQDTANPRMFNLFLCADWVLSWDKCKVDIFGQLGTTNVIITIGVYYVD